MSDGLTPEESAWLKKLNRLLANCPTERLGFYTIGDPSIEVYDKTFEEQISDIMDNSNRDFGPTVEAVGAHLGRIEFPSNVAATSG